MYYDLLSVLHVCLNYLCGYACVMKLNLAFICTIECDLLELL